MGGGGRSRCPHRGSAAGMREERTRLRGPRIRRRTCARGGQRGAGHNSRSGWPEQSVKLGSGHMLWVAAFGAAGGNGMAVVWRLGLGAPVAPLQVTGSERPGTRRCRQSVKKFLSGCLLGATGRAASQRTKTKAENEARSETEYPRKHTAYK